MKKTSVIWAALAAALALAGPAEAYTWPSARAPTSGATGRRRK